jgi:hypothetical protein
VGNRVEVVEINVSKCYNDVFEAKESLGELLTSFKIEIMVNQEKIFKEINILE